MSTITRTYDSLSEAVDQAAKKSDERGASHKAGNGHAWDLGASWRTTLGLARNGWTERITDMEAQASTIANDASIGEASDSYRIDMVQSEAGAFPDVEAFLQGEPECMNAFIPTPVPSDRVVSVAVAVGAPHYVDAEDLVKRGAAIVALVDVARRCGVNVEVWAVWETSSAGNTYSASVKVKEADAPTDLAELAFALAHPTMLRRIMFGLGECESDKFREAIGFTPYGGYGRSGEKVQPATVDATGADVTVDRIQGHGNDPIVNDPAGWVRRTLQGMGIHLED